MKFRHPGHRQLLAGRSGFTIVEMLVTIVIISVLASAVMPMAELTLRRNKEQDLRRALLQIREALDAYKEASDKGHIVRQVGESGFPPTLATLANGVIDAKSQNGAKLYFLRRIPRDPLNQDTSLPAEDTWGKRSYESSAIDPKEGRDVYDIYSLDVRTGMNGIEYKQW
ncbi:MAG: type II secretion system protein [Pseudomonadota bacterium]